MVSQRWINPNNRLKLCIRDCLAVNCASHSGNNLQRFFSNPNALQYPANSEFRVCIYGDWRLKLFYCRNVRHEFRLCFNYPSRASRFRWPRFHPGNRGSDDCGCGSPFSKQRRIIQTFIFVDTSPPISLICLLFSKAISTRYILDIYVWWECESKRKRESFYSSKS